MGSLLDRFRIARACPPNLPVLASDERVRFCAECGKNVYNLSAMTRVDAEALLRQHEGKLCTSYYRRADGTIVTADCGAELIQVRWTAPRVAAAVLVSAGVAMAQAAGGSVAGVVKDSAGAGIDRVIVTLTHKTSGKSIVVRSRSDGRFDLQRAVLGRYTLRVESPGFASLTRELALDNKRTPEIEATLMVGSVGGPTYISPTK